MSERSIIEKILKMVPNCSITFEGDRCAGVDLTSSNCIFEGLIRNYSNKDKEEIVKLIAELPSLKTINLRKNRLQKIPGFDLSRTEFLNLGSNYLKKVNIHGEKLLYLDLSVNELEEAPVLNCKNLVTLKLHKNHIKELPDYSHLQSLEFLNLYLNRMNKIPEFTWQLGNLKFFSWGISSIKEIPTNVKNLHNLNWLSLVANKITCLPEELCNLKSLIGLRLHKNEIERLPENFGKLQNLKSLTLYQNKLTCLPSSFSELKFEKLNIADNPLPFEYREIAKKTCSHWFVDELGSDFFIRSYN
jgi:internalin A